MLNGNNTTVPISALEDGAEYIVAVLEYNGNTGQEKYNVNTATGNPITFATTALPNVSMHFDGVDD